jgi:Arc/MetJ-type ribon-helix-helix transcriptional regulator
MTIITISTKITEKEVEDIDNLIKQGKFNNRSDALRTIVRSFLSSSKEPEKQEVPEDKKSWEVMLG